MNRGFFLPALGGTQDSQHFQLLYDCALTFGDNSIDHFLFDFGTEEGQTVPVHINDEASYPTVVCFVEGSIHIYVEDVMSDCEATTFLRLLQVRMVETCLRHSFVKSDSAFLPIVTWFENLQQPFGLPSQDLGAGELKSSSQPFAFCFGQHPCQKNVVYVLDQFFSYCNQSLLTPNA